VECKHYKKGVPPEKLQSLIAWAHAERPHVALIVVSNFLSNPAKDYLADYEQNNRPPFRIKYWERKTIERLVEGKDQFLAPHIRAGIRSESEILAAEQEFFDLVWYDRHQMLVHTHNQGEKAIFTSKTQFESAESFARELEQKYGDKVGPHSGFDWGIINGKLSALRWGARRRVGHA
jgi:hypothetical protein